MKRSDNDHLKREFFVVFPLNHVNRFINFNILMRRKQAKQHFMISNTDRSSKAGTDCWSILDIAIFLFDSFGILD